MKKKKKKSDAMSCRLLWLSPSISLTIQKDVAVIRTWSKFRKTSKNLIDKRFFFGSYNVDFSLTRWYVGSAIDNSMVLNSFKKKNSSYSIQIGLNNSVFLCIRFVFVYFLVRVSKIQIDFFLPSK